MQKQATSEEWVERYLEKWLVLSAIDKISVDFVIQVIVSTVRVFGAIAFLKFSDALKEF